MSVSANQPIRMAAGKRRAHPVAAGVRIYGGTIVYLTAAGYATDVSANGANGFLGIAVDEADNTGGSAGDISVEVYAEGDFDLVGAGTYTQADVGSPVYGDDNYTINLSIGATSVPIGSSVGFVNATTLTVRIKPTNTGALPVAALTTITHTSPGSPDYAIANVTNSSAYGFTTSDEANTVLSVIRNLQIRVADLEARSR